MALKDIVRSQQKSAGMDSNEFPEVINNELVLFTQNGLHIGGNASDIATTTDTAAKFND